MSYTSLMVHVDVEGKLGGRVNVAAELADRFDARLIGVGAYAPMPGLLGEHGSNQPPIQLLDATGQEFRAAVARKGRHVEWRSVLDDPLDAVAREARAADLVIIGNHRESAGTFPALDPAKLVLKAGRPILIVPTAVDTLAARRVAVAWRDTREARRAVYDAIPFLQRAESVLIVEISEGDESEHALAHLKDLSAYLSRHRVEVVAERVRPDEVGASVSLLNLIRDENVDLLVAGAYGHSRFGEWAFGGVTRSLLMESPICCLLSH